VQKRDDDFRSTIYSFGEVEGEVHALCRWLRARKFNYEEVVTMVEEATVERSQPGAENFYRDTELALGVTDQVYISAFPQLYHGSAKSGSVVFYSQPGYCDVNSIVCMTSVDGVLKYHWHAMMNDFGDRLRARKKQYPEEFTRFQCITVMDLENLGIAQINQRCLSIIKTQCAIDSLCFPETLDRFVIINAPRFFTATWSLVKGWLDARTVAKIEIISSKNAGEKRLKELIDEDQIPKNYGGTAESTADLLMKAAPEGCIRQKTELMSFRSSSHFKLDLEKGEKVDIVVYTRCCSGALFQVIDDKKTVVVDEVDVAHKGGSDVDKDKPTKTSIVVGLAGPGKYKIKAVLKSSHFSSVHFFVVCNIFN